MSEAGAAFLAADGGRIKNHGEVKLNLLAQDSKGRRHKITSKFEAADVNRALQSTGATCDQGKEVLFTRDACYVVTAGLLSPVIKPMPA